MKGDWRFAIRPVWIAGHFVALLAAVAFVAASSWQFTRLEQRNTLNEAIDEGTSAPTIDLGEIIDEGPESIRFRTVTATGSFDPSAEVMLVLQSLNGVSGHRVLTPLVVSDEPGFDAVVVDRGWVPLELDLPNDPLFAAPEGEVTVTGIVRTTQTVGRRVPAEGVLEQIGRVDLDRLQEQIEYRIAPVFLHLSDQAPTGSGRLPTLAPLPTLDPGSPHLSYAVQWLIFAAIVVVGYGILMVRTSMLKEPVGSAAT